MPVPILADCQCPFGYSIVASLVLLLLICQQASASVDFIQLTDPHLFGDVRENEQALTACIQKINALNTIKEYSFVVLTGDLGIEDLLSTMLSRRVTYLARRVQSVSEHEPDSSDNWRKPMVVAGLWIEAAEGTVALAQFKRAREYLYHAVRQFLILDMPFGAALQRTLFIQDTELFNIAERVMQLWGDHVSELESTMSPSDTDDELPAAALESPQQWAYFALAVAGADHLRWESRIGFEDLAEKLAHLKSVPIGRVRLPLDSYQFIAGFSSDAVRFRGDVSSQRSESAAEVIAKSLLGLYQSLQWARPNTYLWARMLAPAPMFDLDTALLIARTLEAPEILRANIMDRVQSSLPEDARAYAVEFIQAVQALRADRVT
jgi:hypothetical protein